MHTDEGQDVLIPCPEGKKIYFASDFHLGAPDDQASLERERAIVQWLDEAGRDAAHLFLVGDLFDFWFEYKKVIPKGHVRLLGKLATMADSGIGISVFTGNHDMWMDGYLERQLGCRVYYDPSTFLIGGKKFFIGHGDGLGPGDHRYKLLKKIFRSRLCQRLFAFLHPFLGISLADALSRRSRLMTQEESFLGEDREWLVSFSKEKLKETHFDYFVFGHRHLPLDIPLAGGSRYINLGDWLHHFSYGVFDGNGMHLCHYRAARKKATGPVLP
jgi:UDP-2,3-diacylglucosamine hydrolase